MAETGTTEADRDLDELAINTIRTLSMDAVQKANSGHPGTPMGLAPLGYVLYTRIMRHNPANPGWIGRDKFVLSPGHACMLQYALLHLCGYDLPLDEIKNFRQWDSKCPGHPEYGVTPGIEISTGPLGQGFANGVGFALAEARYAELFNRGEQKVVDHFTYVVCSDGDMEEGIASEAASFAGNLGLGKLIAIYDDNEISIEGSTSLAFDERVADRFKAYGWSVHELPAEAAIEQIELAIREAQGVTDAPSLIVLPDPYRPRQPEQAGHRRRPRRAARRGGGPADQGEPRLALRASRSRSPTRSASSSPASSERGIEAELDWEQRFETYAAEHPELAEELQRVNRRHAPDLPLDRRPAEVHARRRADGDEVGIRQSAQLACAPGSRVARRLG